MTQQTVLEAPVLVVGAGPVGLTAAIVLARAGVRSLLVERHPGTSIHPKARGLNVRTMELIREWGIEDDVRAAGLPPEEHGFFYRGATLTAPEFERTGGGGLASAAQVLSPATWMVISQDALEPVLLAHLRALDRSDVRFDHELESLEAAGPAARASVRDRRSGDILEVKVDYVIGADGASSTVREELAIELEGQGPLVDNVSILFEASIGPLIADRLSAVYFLTTDPSVRPRGYPMSVGNPPPDGVVLTVDNAERWLLVVGLDGEPGSTRPPIDDVRAAELVRRAIGIELPIRIVGMMPWSPAARVADRYRVGRAFVAGDAAHEMTPSGAFGLNVGMQDAQNVAWKLAAVLTGWASPDLLATYDPERRPAGRFAAEQSHLQFLGTRPPKPFGNWGVILGTTYVSDSIVPDGTPPPALADPAVDYRPDARPGARAPHAWITSSGVRRSTIDLYGAAPVLLAGRSAAAWASAAAAAAEATSIPLRIHQLGVNLEPEDPAAFAEVHGFGQDGAILVRPDGYVAWRAAEAPVDRDGFQGVLEQVFGRRTPLASVG